MREMEEEQRTEPVVEFQFTKEEIGKLMYETFWKHYTSIAGPMLVRPWEERSLHAHKSWEEAAQAVAVFILEKFKEVYEKEE